MRRQIKTDVMADAIRESFVQLDIDGVSHNLSIDDTEHLLYCLQRDMRSIRVKMLEALRRPKVSDLVFSGICTENRMRDYLGAAVTRVRTPVEIRELQEQQKDMPEVPFNPRPLRTLIDDAVADKAMESDLEQDRRVGSKVLDAVCLALVHGCPSDCPAKLSPTGVVCTSNLCDYFVDKRL